MSNPPFGSVFHDEEDDFSFPYEPPNNFEDPINFPIPSFVQHQNTNLPTTSSSKPMLDYQDLSIYDYMEDYNTPLIGQYYPNKQDTFNWPVTVSPIELITEGFDQVQQGAAEGSLSDHDMQCYNTTATTTADGLTAAAAVAAVTAAAAVVSGVGEGSLSKKLDHNAREKVRRKKLNETYLTLRSLLPDSKRAKKKWSAPYIIDRTLDYVPQLQAELEKLTLEKNNMLLVLEKKQQIDAYRDYHDAKKINETLTVSINEVKMDEVIVQICVQNEKVCMFSNLLERLEGEGMHVLGASSLRACEDRSCFHLHLQKGEKSVEANYVAILNKKIISWLS